METKGSVSPAKTGSSVPADTTPPSWKALVRRPWKAAVFRSLRHRNYRLFFFGQLLSLLGTWMQNIGQAWLVYELTHSAAWLGAVGFLNSLPILLLSMFTGTVADRVPKRRLIVATQAASMIQAFVLAVLVWTRSISAELVGVLAFTLGIVNAFDIPARQAFVVEMVGKEDLTNAVALNSAIFNSARMFGPAVGGIIIGALGVGWCFLLNGVSFLAVIFGLLLMDVKDTVAPGPRERSVIKSMREGVAFIRADAGTSSVMLLIALLTIFGWSYSVLLPIFADQVLGIGAIGLGNLLTATGVGALISALSVASLSHKVNPRRFIYGGLFLFSGAVIVFAVSSSTPLSLLALVGVGMGLVAFFATANGFLQMRSPDHLRGRVMGLYSLVFQGLFPFGSLGIGFLAEVIGVRYAVLSGAGVCAVAGAAVYNVRRRQRKTGNVEDE